MNSRIKTVEKLLEAGERKAKLDPVHDQYVKIHWKGRKEKFHIDDPIRPEKHCKND